jgi:hypothetical protein
MSNKDKFTDYDSTASNNTNVGGVNLAENSALPSDLNNAVREVMSHIKDGLGSGTPLYVDQTNDRLGIGTTSPSTTLDVVRNGVQPLRVQSTSGTEVAINMVNTGGNVQLEAHSGNFNIDADSVGIGTTTPSSYDSRGNNLVVGDSGDAGITIFSGATSDARLVFAASGDTGLSNGQIHYDNNDDKLRIATGGSDRLAINSSGYVGIGTTSPSRGLHIHHASSSAFKSMQFTDPTSGTTSADGYIIGMDSGQNGYVWNYENEDLYFGTNNITRLNIKNDGRIAYMSEGSTSVRTTSDLRQGAAKSWGNIDGTGTTHIDDSYNMSSVTDAGTGQYDFFINNDMNNAHFTTSLSSEIGGGNGGFNGLNDSSSYYTAARYRFIAYTNTGSRRDVDPAFGVVHGDLA